MQTATPEFVMNLPLLFDRVGQDKFEQKIDDPDQARDFAEGLRAQHSDFIKVEQRLGRVLITIK